MQNQDELVRGWLSGYLTATNARPDLAAFACCWPLPYLAVASPDRAVQDASVLTELQPGEPVVSFATSDDDRARFTIMSAGRPVGMSEVLPKLHSLGLDVHSEQPFRLDRPDGMTCWVYDYVLEQSATAIDQAPRLEEAFTQLWVGAAETDSYNRLITSAGLSWRQACVLRAYGQYLHQLRVPWSPAFSAAVLDEHHAVTRDLSSLFELRLRPRAAARPDDVLARRAKVAERIDQVENLLADRVLRSFLDLIEATVRTNAFLERPDGERQPAHALALKLDASRVREMPEPRPRFEVFVSSPRIEGVHLRFGAIARGGIRWSDRPEDLRTEVLGLAVAQVAKNAVIVPTGAKGGFVCKSSGKSNHGARDGRAAYREFVSALLEVHDDLDGDGQSRPIPPGVVAHEGLDAYLVVAADKGTATFSDTANELAVARDFWLGDAFASGGSAGYDHKAMGITARGAWSSVKRHLAELGRDPDLDEVSVVGIGDMSGDVFGNGLLLSEHLRLIAAFDHRHVFIDPYPDPRTSYQERVRLFQMQRSSWADYDPSVISAGGGVFPRSAKRVLISPQARTALSIDQSTTSLTPAQLIRAILRAPVDLLWNGGVGTYVKASSETDTDVGDKVNDAVRVNALAVRSRVVAEGGNLGFTQRARIEYALAGGKINTDAMDNSAGVGCSDREVNMKIAVRSMMQHGRVRAEQRLPLLQAMTDQVADLVLAQNVAQNDILGLCRQHSDEDLDLHARAIADLESRSGINRVQLALPDDAELDRRRRDARGLTSPELAVLAAYVKLDLRNTLLECPLPDDEGVRHFLLDYFPAQLREISAEELLQHPLRREVVATEVVNTIVGSAGPGWVHRMRETTAAGVADIVRAYLVATAVFDLPSLWTQINRTSPTTEVAGALVWESIRVLDRSCRWLLQRRPQPLEIDHEVSRFRSGVAVLAPRLPALHQGTQHIDYLHRLTPLIEAGAEPEQTRTVFDLLERFCLLDVIEIAAETGAGVAYVAELYFLVKESCDIDTLLSGVSNLPRGDRWSALARLGIRDDLYESVKKIVTAILVNTANATCPADAVRAWESAVGPRLGTMQAVIKASQASAELANLTVAARQIKTLSLLTSMR